jgi:NAD(P)-dependent dehydrogenase (short-subunit alcohol dehydrogenase family)
MRRVAKGLKQTDNRYFALVNENGTISLTWGKGDDGKSMAAAQQRFPVASIEIQWTGEKGKGTGAVNPSFNLVLPPDVGEYAQSEKQAAKAAKKAAKAAAKGGKKDAKAAAKKAKAEAKAAAKAVKQAAMDAASEAAAGAATGMLSGVDDDSSPMSNPLADSSVGAPAEAEAEPEPAAEEGEPPSPVAGSAEAAEELSSCEISPMKGAGPALVAFVEALLANGANITGGASADVMPGGHNLAVVQEAANGIEFELDRNNLLTGFKGTMTSVKGITKGLKISMVNDTPVLGWPNWAVMTKIKDPDATWPLNVAFIACQKTLVIAGTDEEPRAPGMVAVVAGGSKGLGFELANVLVAEGANVTVLARGQEGLDAARKMLITAHFKTEAAMKSAGRDVSVYACDLADAAACGATVDKILADNEQIDLLINAAGTGGAGITVTTDSTAEDLMSHVQECLIGNVQTMLNISKAVVEKAMAPAGSGQVINLSCTQGRRGRPADEPLSYGFGFSKEVLEKFTAKLSTQYQSKRVRFNLMVPGRVPTGGFPPVEGCIDVYQEAGHVRYGLQALLDSDMSNETVDCVQEMNLATAEPGDEDEDDDFE